MPLFLLLPSTENYEITHERKSWTHEIPTRKYLEPTKYPRRYDGTMALEPPDPRWHATHEIYHTLSILASK